jgi:hypothetical protein
VLAQRLAARDDAALGALTGVAADALLIVIGDPAALPWVDGISYLGCDAAAPGLLLPTALAPSIPPRVLEAAVRARMEPGPVAVLTAPARLVPCGAARAIDRAQLVAWQARS